MIYTRVKIFFAISVLVFIAATVFTVKNVGISVSSYQSNAAELEAAAQDRLPGLVCPALVSGLAPGDSDEEAGGPIAQTQAFFLNPNVQGLLGTSDQKLTVSGVYDEPTEKTLAAFQGIFNPDEPIPTSFSPDLVKLIEDVCLSIKFNSQMPQ